MSDKFISEWVRSDDTPVSRRIAEKIHSVPLKDKISKTTYRFNVVQKRLDDARSRMEQKHKMLFDKCVRAQRVKDSSLAIMYANECAQVKKITQTIITSQLALEQVILRLETVRDFGNLVVELLPASAIIKNLLCIISPLNSNLSLLAWTAIIASFLFIE